jgi:hypothetical protein
MSVNHKKLYRLSREEGLAPELQPGAPALAHDGLPPQTAFIRSAGGRLRNPDQLRRPPATVAALEQAL